MMLHTSACHQLYPEHYLGRKKEKKTLHDFSQGLLQQIFCFRFLAIVGMERLLSPGLMNDIWQVSSQLTAVNRSRATARVFFMSLCQLSVVCSYCCFSSFCLSSQFVISHSTSHLFTLCVTSLHTLALVFAFALFVGLPLV